MSILTSHTRRAFDKGWVAVPMAIELTDEPQSSMAHPGTGQSGNNSHIQRGRQNPGTRHFGSSRSRTHATPTPRTRRCHGPSSPRPTTTFKEPLDKEGSIWSLSEIRDNW